MNDENEPEETIEPAIKQELNKMFQLGGDILRQANEQIEGHLSKTVDDFKTNQIDSWQELYDKLVDKYGPQAAEWKDAALHSLENQVSRMDKTQNEHWMEFESYHDVEAYLESLGAKVAEPDIRDWVTQGKSWISVREGRIYLDPHQADFPSGKS